jgi:ELWxxDGT repeat protein
MKSTPAILEPLEQRQLLAATARLVNDSVEGIGSGLIFGNTSYAILGQQLAYPSNGRAWVSTGDSLDTFAVTDAKFTQAYDFVNVKGLVYFTGKTTSAGPLEIFQTNGITSRPPQQVTNFAGTAAPVFLRGINNTLVFFTTNTTAPKTPGLYRLPQTGEAGTDPQLMLSMSDGLFLGQANGTQFFAGSSDDLSQIGLWGTNGTTAGFVHDFSIGTESGLGTSWSAPYKGQLYFAAATLATGMEVWKSDGTDSGTVPIGEINAGSDGSSPYQFTPSGGTLYFVAQRKGVQQIFSTTGSKPKQLTSFAPGSITSLADINGTPYFNFTPNTSSTGLLYKLSGGIATVVPVGNAGGNSPQFITAVGSTAYFSGVDSQSVRRLYSSDGKSISLVGGDAGTNPSTLVNVNGSLFFEATDPTHGNELHIVKNSAPTTTPIGLKLIAYQNTINEGSYAYYKATVNPGVTIDKFFWDDIGNGIFHAEPAYTKLFYKNDSGQFSNTVRVIARASDGSSEEAEASLKVLNVAPTVTLSVPKTWTTYLPMPYKVTIEDPGQNDLETTDVSWSGGTGTDGFESNRVVTGTRRFLSLDSQEIRVKVHDPDGGTGFAHLTVKIVPLADAVLGKDVIFGGTEENDVLRIAKSANQPTNGKITLDFFRNGELLGTRTLDPHAIIEAGMGPGNDKFFAPSDVTDLFVFKINGDEGKFDEFNGKVIK